MLSIASTIALLTTMLVMTSLSARTIKVAAEDKILPKFLSKDSKNDQPIYAVIVTVLISAGLCFFPNLVTEMVDLGVLFNVLSICIVVVSLFFARKREVLPKDGFRLKGGKF